MPDALFAALAALFADPNIGRDAVYIADGGAPVMAQAEKRSSPPSRRGCRRCSKLSRRPRRI
jgi:hypothetical protein